MIKMYEAYVMTDDGLTALQHIGPVAGFAEGGRTHAEHQAYELAAEEIPGFPEQFENGKLTILLDNEAGRRIPTRMS